jgi:hypothetical protein
MPIELDHLFVCTAPGAPEAEKLVQFGLHEGPQDQHPGQGTANRHFAFANAMIELLWVSDAREAQSQSTKRTLLARDGLVAKAAPLLSAFACGLSILKTQGCLFPQGSTGRRICQILFSCILAKRELRSPCGFI